MYCLERLGNLANQQLAPTDGSGRLNCITDTLGHIPIISGPK
jgi:hypothetical protein